MKQQSLESTASRVLVDLVKEACAAVSHKAVSQEAERFFFPHGIELIRASITVGAPSAPLVSPELVLAGAAAPHVPKAFDLTEALTTRALLVGPDLLL